jgi:hypothetical protein
MENTNEIKAGDLVKLSPMCYDRGTTEIDKCFIVLRDYTIEEEAKVTYDFMAERATDQVAGEEPPFTLEEMLEECRERREEEGTTAQHIAADLQGDRWLLKALDVRGGYAANRLRANGWQTFWNDAAFWALTAHNTGNEEVAL